MSDIENGQEQQATTGGDWTAGLPPDLKPLVETKGWKTPADALSSYMNLEKTVGAEKLPLPPKDAQGNRDWSKWDGWNALGRPESPDKYDLGDVKMPEGAPIDEQAKAGFFAHAHKIGLTNAQAKEIFGWYGGFLEQAMTGNSQQAAEETAQAEAALKKEWGKAFEAKIDGANRVVRQFGGKDLVAELEKTGMGRNPMLVKALAAIADAIGEDGELGGSKPGAAMSPAEAKSEISRMETDEGTLKILMNKQHPEYDALVAKRNRLYALAYPDEAA